MPPADSTAPLSQLFLHHLRRHRPGSSSLTSPPSTFWSPIAGFAAATERARAGTLSPEDAHHLFDELLRQATPVPGRFLNAFLVALARAPASDACRDGPALAVALFNRIRRVEAGPRLAPLSAHTYSILMDCCCRAHLPDLGLAIFGRFLRTGMETDELAVSTFLKCLWDAKQTDEAVNLLNRMCEFGSVPSVISYSTVLKSLCDSRRSQLALDLLKMMAQRPGCFPNVVAYSTVIDGLFKEGEVGKAFNLFDEMMQQGVVPDVVTYTSIIDALCKARAMDKAELVLRQMVDNGVQPNKLTYNIMMRGYFSLGQWKEASKMFREMTNQGTWKSFKASLRKHGRTKEAADMFESMTAKGHKPD